MEKNKYDLTQGNILNKLLVVAMPIMGTQFMQMTYNLTDMFWLGQLSSEAVAASGTVGMYLWLSMAFLMLGRMGAEIGVSQNLGSNEFVLARKYAHSSFWLALFLGILFTATMIIFCKPLIAFFNIREATVVADAELYMSIVALGIPFLFLTNVITGVFNGSGNSKIPFYLNAVGWVINMVLDPILIFTFEFGIAGAAWASVIAQSTVCITSMVAVRYFRSRPLKDFRFFEKLDKTCYPRIFSWGLPIAMESLFFTLLSMLVARLVSGWGSDAIAVQRVSSQVESLSWLIAGGFASAVTAFIGQNFGAGRWERIHKGFRIATISMLVWGVFITAVLFFFGGAIFSIFISDPHILELGVVCLQITAACQLTCCIEATTAGCLRGMGKTLPPSIVSITVNALRVPLAYYLATTVGLNGIWWAISIGGIARGAILFSYYLWASRKMPLSDAQTV